MMINHSPLPIAEPPSSRAEEMDKKITREK